MGKLTGKQPLELFLNKSSLFSDGVITDLEPDILGCEVKWALESITVKKTKLVKVMEFQLSYFKS